MRKTAQQKMHKKRLARGICAQCGKNPLDTKTMCRSCADRMRKNQKKRRETRHAQGLCVSCGKNPLYTKERCYECAKKNAEQSSMVEGYKYESKLEKAARKRWIVEQYIPGERAISTAKRLEVTREQVYAALNEQGIKYQREIMPRKDLSVTRQREYQRILNEKGLCCQCGKGPLFTKTACYACASKAARRAKRKYRPHGCHEAKYKEIAESYQPGEDSLVALVERFDVGWHFVRRALEENDIIYERPAFNRKSRERARLLVEKFNPDGIISEEAKRLNVNEKTLIAALKTFDVEYMTKTKFKRKQLAENYMAGKPISVEAERLGTSPTTLRYALREAGIRSEEGQACKVCGKATVCVYNIEFKAVPVCDRCADSITMQNVQDSSQCKELR